MFRRSCVCVCQEGVVFKQSCVCQEGVVLGSEKEGYLGCNAILCIDRCGFVLKVVCPCLFSVIPSSCDALHGFCECRIIPKEENCPGEDSCCFFDCEKNMCQNI